uniref:Uncharacterized protein n=1 Tax=Timema tahoe TaxID=61484 RepID=A0A7R9ICR8_9NEOP|nr:unnamed protein product [Timema tahoe]
MLANYTTEAAVAPIFGPRSCSVVILERPRRANTTDLPPLVTSHDVIGRSGVYTASIYIPLLRSHNLSERSRHEESADRKDPPRASRRRKLTGAVWPHRLHRQFPGQRE